MRIAELVHGRTILVTGKGGVGKTTVAAALGLLASAQGRRTLVVELGSQHPSLTSIFGVRPRHEPTEVAPHLSIANLDWHEGLREWVGRAVPVSRVVRLILENRLVRRFLDATPGNREMVLLSKLAWLRDAYDLVVVDMPASGHAVAMLHLPDNALMLFKAGPIHDRAQEIRAMLQDRATAMVLVAIPERMVVNETLETADRVRREVPDLQLGPVVLNRATHPSMTPDERELLGRLSALHPDPATPAGELLWAGRWEDRLEQSTAEALDRLVRGVRQRVVEVPRMDGERGTGRMVRRVAAALVREQGVAP